MKEVQKLKNPTVSDFNKFKKPLKDEDLITYYTYRKISGAIAWLFYKIKLKAEQVAVLAFLMDIIAIYLIINNKLLFGVLFIQLSILFDCSDGQLARYYISIGKKDGKKKWGEYVDSILGLPGFAFVIFFTGYHFSMLAGVIGMFTLLMLNVTSAKSNIFADKKKEAYTKAKKSILGKIEGRIGLTHDIQRFLISFALIFNSVIFVWIFVGIGSFWWIIKFWAYRNY